jgi:hypothetical protein
LWRDLREATREVRPDWNPGVSGLRAAWEAGDRGSFFHDVDLDPSLRAAQRHSQEAPSFAKRG